MEICGSFYEHSSKDLFSVKIGQFLDNPQNHRPKEADTSSWHATAKYSKRTEFYNFIFLSNAEASSLVVARVNNVIVSWFATARVKATINGIHNSLNNYVIMKHVYVQLHVS